SRIACAQANEGTETAMKTASKRRRERADTGIPSRRARGGRLTPGYAVVQLRLTAPAGRCPVHAVSSSPLLMRTALIHGQDPDCMSRQPPGKRADYRWFHAITTRWMDNDV